MEQSHTGQASTEITTSARRLKTGRRWRRRLTTLRHTVRVPTARWRALPDFLVLGTQRGGTSSLYRYLSGHPDVVASLRKETEYFAGRYAQGINWYRAHFPLEAMKRVRPDMVTFEATPDYLFHPLAASRASLVVPQARLVVLLRDPVARAYSHFRHMQRLGFENLDFASALEAEQARIVPDLERLAAEPDYRPVNFLRYSYKARGRYLEQLMRWLAVFPSQLMLVLSSESFYKSTGAEFAKILQFLGLRDLRPPRFHNISQSASEINQGSIDPEISADLASYFREYNQALYEALNVDLGWT